MSPKELNNIVLNLSPQQNALILSWICGYVEGSTDSPTFQKEFYRILELAMDRVVK